jgi:pimeloyl-ACP methyl ester carboxylesterase
MAQAAEATGAQVVAESMLPKLFATSTRGERPALVEETARVILRTSPQGMAAAQRGMAERVDMTARLGEIDVPTLVICGEHDAISTPAEMRELAQAMPRAEYVEIKEAGHLSPCEQPEAVTRAIRIFLGGWD